MATKSHIFLFDIFLLGPQAFRNGLQAVLEDKNILKVRMEGSVRTFKVVGVVYRCVLFTREVVVVHILV